MGLTDKNRVGGGGFADVYKGVLNGTQVAVKQVRIFVVTTEDERQKMNKVWGIIRIALRN